MDRKKNKRFVAHCQEPLLVGILWTILDAAHSQVSQVRRLFRLIPSQFTPINRLN